jgi:phage terminase large subunit-like protein
MMGSKQEYAVRGADMNESNTGFDYDRYRELLANATDETKRMALINLLIEEGAQGKLTRQRIGRLGLTSSSDQPLDET